jgi:hypothetical protein
VPASLVAWTAHRSISGRSFLDPARVEIHPDGIVVDVRLEDGNGRRIEVRIDDRDGMPRRRSTLLAPVSSGWSTRVCGMMSGIPQRRTPVHRIGCHPMTT